MLRKIGKLKKLLNVDDNYIGLLGIKDKVEGVDEVNIEIKPEDIEIKKKEDKQGIKQVDNFKIQLHRKTSDDTIKNNNPFLPNIPFAIYLLGVVKAGKSTFMRSLLDIYAEAFDKIFFISPTFALDPEAIDLLDSYDGIEAFSSLSILDGVMKKLTKINKGKSPQEKVKVLVIMDDVINELIKFCKKENNFINRMATNRRHIGISFMLLSQYFKRCPPLLRNNFSSFVLFRQENQAERRKIVEELSGYLGKEKFEELFDEATREPYSALTINFDAPSKEYQYTKNFNTILISNPDELDKFDKE
jgi:hypothetical protein